MKRVFIANRGEIAVRLLRACRKLGLQTVLGVSDADRKSAAAELADRTICIGPTAASASYLNAVAIVTAAKGTGCDALHPGYGFLSERAAFARLCIEHGLTFVGPAPETIDTLGDKLQARRLAQSLGVPLLPGTDAISSAAEARAACETLDYPVLIKASAGGGGRGMRVVRSPDALAAALRAASAEAQAAFGDGRLYIERFIDRARHIEVQILGDGRGTVIHLGERDCSVQRRHQKLIEEAPATPLAEDTRRAMGEAALRLAAAARYRNAGTIEFVYDADRGDFYFLEVNTRLQVEHPVTECITGIDIVCEQLRIAAGEAVSVSQTDIQPRGHAIECRINAEDPARQFQPSPGLIEHWKPPVGSAIRLDTHCRAGYVVPPFYDSLLAKLIVHGRDRAEAIALMQRALADFAVNGVKTTIPMHRTILAHPDFASGRVTTRWLENVMFAGGPIKAAGGAAG
jgi:acetyl-CoA carboxylase biotin carboxylase subunit